MMNDDLQFCNCMNINSDSIYDKDSDITKSQDSIWYITWQTNKNEREKVNKINLFKYEE